MFINRDACYLIFKEKHDILPLSFLPSVDPQGLAPDLFSWQAFPMAHTHRHCILSPLRGQLACYLRALHPRHLWPHRYVYTGRMAVRSGLHCKFCSVCYIICELCNYCVRPLINSSLFSSFRSHICTQPHLYPTWNFLRPDRSWRAGAFSVQTQDSGTTQFLQLSRIPWIYLGHLQFYVFFNVLLIQMFVSFPSAPVGRMLCCTGIHLHDHEFVIYHHWLGDWRESKRRRALAAMTEQRYWGTECQPKLSLSLNYPWSAQLSSKAKWERLAAQDEGCVKSLRLQQQRQKKEKKKAFWHVLGQTKGPTMEERVQKHENTKQCVVTE